MQQGALGRAVPSKAWAAKQPVVSTLPPTAAQGRAWEWVDSLSTHPGYGATVAVVNGLFRAAEYGQLSGQCDLFDDLIESDGHLRALIGARIAAVAGRDWVIQAGDQSEPSIKAAIALERALRRANFRQFVEHHLTANYYGYAATETIWQFIDGVHVPARFEIAPHSRFIFNGWSELRLLQEGNQITGEALIPDQWVVSRMPHKNVARAGLMRTAAWWSLFKRIAVRDWIVYTEKFGIPNVLGFYADNASTEAKDAIEKAVRDVGKAGQAVLSESTRIVLTEVAQRGGAGAEGLHSSLVALCESQMAKLINGSTLTTETGGPGSFALGKVHEARQFSLEKDDARRMSETFREQIGGPFIRFNGFMAASAPVLKIQLMQDMAPLERLEAALKIIEAGGEVDRSQLMDEIGFRAPSRPEDALKGRTPESVPDPTPAPPAKTPAKGAGPK